MSEIEWQAAAFRRLVAHLQAHPQVQNIHLMNLSGFCRNCLSKWYQEAAAADGAALDYEQSRELIYGMPYSEYKARYQTPATPEQQAAFARKQQADSQQQ